MSPSLPRVTEYVGVIDAVMIMTTPAAMEYHNATPPGCEDLDISEGAAWFAYTAEAFIQPVILACGFLTNLASLVVLRAVRMNEVFRICLMSLSIVDALACLAGFTQLVVEVKYFHGDICQGYMDPRAIASNTLYFAYMMFMCASAAMVILIAIIRNVFVLRPMKARAYFTTPKTKLFCFIAFLVTFIFFLPVPFFIINQSCELEVDNSLCDWLNGTNLGEFGLKYVHYFMSILFGPFIIIVYITCVICIRVTVQKSVKTLTLITPRTSKASNNSEVGKVGKDSPHYARSKTAARITKTLLIILIFDVCCTVPYVIQGIGLLVDKGHSIFNDKSSAGKIYDAIVEICLNLRPSYNFWLYIFQHPEYRVRLRLLWHRMCMPCYKSSSCPCCKMLPEATTPLRSPPNWSSTPSTGDHRGPWFRRLTSKQSNKDSVFIPPVMPHNLTKMSPAKNNNMADSMVSIESDIHHKNNISYL